MKEYKKTKKLESFIRKLNRYPEIKKKWDAYVKQNRAKEDRESVAETLKYIYGLYYDHPREYNYDEIAINIVKIDRVFERLRDGDESVVKDIAKAFTTKNVISLAQLRYITCFCSLYNIKEFPSYDECVELLLRGIGYLKDNYIQISEVINAIVSIRDLYVRIREGLNDDNLSNADIYDKIHAIFLEIFNKITSNVTKDIISGIVIAVLNANGIPVTPELISCLVGIIWDFVSARIRK